LHYAPPSADKPAFAKATAGKPAFVPKFTEGILRGFNKPVAGNLILSRNCLCVNHRV